MAKKFITHWTIKVKWNDGKEEFLEEIPQHIANPVDDHLSAIEMSRENHRKIYAQSKIATFSPF